MPRLGGKKKASKAVVKKRGNLRGYAASAAKALAMKAGTFAFKSRRPLLKAAVAYGAGKAISSLTKTKTGVMRHSNSEGYIPGYSKIIGDNKAGLSFTERVQKAINPPQTLLYHSTAKLESTSGLQNVTSFNLNNTFWNDFFAFIAAGRSDVSTVSTTSYNSAQVTNRANHLWTSIQHTFMNSGNASVEMDIYIYQAIQDIDSGDQSITAASAWSYSESINSLNSVAADGTSVIGKKPTDFSAAQYIRRYWKLISSNSVTMKPGESYKHYFRKHYNRQIAQYMLNADTSASVKGHSLSIVYVVRGQVVGSSLDATVSTADCQVSLVRQVKTQFTYANNMRSRDFLVGSALTAIAPANQIFINTDTSAQTTGYVEDA